MRSLSEIAQLLGPYLSLHSRFNRIALTIGVGAIGISIIANYYLTRRKQILNKTYSLTDMIPELRHANIKIKNPKHVERVLSNIIHSGKQRLQVIIDFDRTITKYEHNGQICNTSYGVFDNSRFISQDLRQKLEDLKNIYMPIEHDHKLTIDQRIPYMVEWWNKAHNLICATNIHRDDITELVKQSTIVLREDCNWFFYTLERYNIPTLVFSAGVGNIVDECLRQKCGIFKNMKIVSNFMAFNSSTSRISGFEGKLIHIFNKNESVLLDTEYEKLIENRHNVIVIGDSVGDSDMAQGMPVISNQLKIGFLNDNVQDLLPVFMEVFDIVIIKDQTFSVPNALLRSII